jgi:putative transposase
MNAAPNSTANPRRTHPAHSPPVWKHNRPVILYVTTCLAVREPILTTDEIHGALCRAWEIADTWRVGFYMIMPDHVHLFCAPGSLTPPSVKTWTTYWRSQLSRTTPALRGKWLPDCWDTQIRSAQQYQQKLEYVANNPVRKELVKRSDDWPFQGRLVDLVWLGD